MRATVYAIALIFLTSGCSKGANEVQACNSAEVKDVILNGTVGKLKKAAADAYSSGSPGPRTPAILDQIARFKGTVTNIRQIKYEPENNARYCAADFEYENVPPIDIMAPFIIGDPTCAKSFNYKIERLLDKPGQFYVSWRCLR
ncbi:MAG: hypothetical protein AB7P20_07995 [Rhizobiaceae bacterium]